MIKKLIILVNSETLCAYRILTDEFSSPKRRIERIDIHLSALHPDPSEASDDEGRFPAGSNVQNRTAMRHGDPHGRKTEKRKRILSNMANSIHALIDQEGCHIWNLAIPAELYHQFIKQLPMHLQHNLTQLKKGDYTQWSMKKIESLFTS